MDMIITLIIVLSIAYLSVYIFRRVQKCQQNVQKYEQELEKEEENKSGIVKNVEKSKHFINITERKELKKCLRN